MQPIIAKFTPFKISPYSEKEKKRSSMGAGLLFWDERDPGAMTAEKRQSEGLGQRMSQRFSKRQSQLNYGSTLPGPVTAPSPTAAPMAQRFDGPPVLSLALGNTRPNSPEGYLVSPISEAGMPKSPLPTQQSPRNSRGSLSGASIASSGGASIASSGVISPSLFSWPMPPSTAGSMISPPTTADPSRFQAKAPQPPTPSNWVQPENWARK